ncbi:hypothetical protein [Mycobacterium szulgai]|uniref:hypothetical protein n=1 Tax=Mycobacterium szulgai TaxID=1787 RepID=UPI0021F34A55|nr:hypothetical protein [Mycobacterium szulgai]MCV7078423.1 hypothetical protein [Mycobacterium szulgai]
MNPLRRRVKIALPLAAIAAVALVVRSRRDVEVWHMAEDAPSDPIVNHPEGP